MVPCKRAESNETNRGNAPKREEHQKGSQRSVKSATFLKIDRQGYMCKSAIASRSLGAAPHERDEYILHRSHLLSMMKNVLTERRIPQRATCDKKVRHES